MIRGQVRGEVRSPALTRLGALASLDQAAHEALVAAMEETRSVRVRRDLMTEGREILQPLLLLSGWAARVRLLPDGRRQFLSFLLPGDLIGACDHPHALAVSTVVAMSDVQVCPLPHAEPGTPLHVAYAISRAMDEGHLLAQITRLGRLNAQERISDLLLELYERLTLNGTVHGNGFDLPLTQETLADALGLTSVHVNRMLQQARREGDLQWRVGHVRLTDPAGLARKIGHVAVRVSER
ncbi:Crp/Fnr family transcriptional regulator [Sphingomonas endophytica]|uniref:Cyclic nucleotide-binding protein n=1 Tax=Sphingomonas endophytica TaxID=869719 RepID=A0A147I557_9SPHN|nr:Crp/Fnr family transcriptional regulator [Sphingomonas endophytica]KTT73759.1 cyclic nucleotide-binding protein [Sphingomonas endophytica]